MKTQYNRCYNELEIDLEDLQHEMKIALNSFKINSVKINPKNFHFMILDKTSIFQVILNINHTTIKEP